VPFAPSKLDEVIGHAGRLCGVFTSPFRAPRDHGWPSPPAIGKAIAISFRLSGDGKAAITAES
jgi:hypothetical protein